MSLDALTPFLRGRNAPYDDVTPVLNKTGLVTSRRASLAHLSDQVAAVVDNGRVRYGARLLCCNTGFADAVLLDSAAAYGGVHDACVAASSPVVYRCFGADGGLVYVGSGCKGAAGRLAYHRLYDPWWQLVTDTTVERFATVFEARIAERRAIENENPARNRAMRKQATTT